MDAARQAARRTAAADPSCPEARARLVLAEVRATGLSLNLARERARLRMERAPTQGHADKALRDLAGLDALASAIEGRPVSAWAVDSGLAVAHDLAVSIVEPGEHGCPALACVTCGPAVPLRVVRQVDRLDRTRIAPRCATCDRAPSGATFLAWDALPRGVVERLPLIRANGTALAAGVAP